jgi:Domain of unknown function (DUF4397)
MRESRSMTPHDDGLRRRIALLVVVAAAILSSIALGAEPSYAASMATPAGSGWIRFGHFVPSAGPVDVKVDSTTIGTDLSFRDVTGYVMVSAGVHTITVSAATPAEPLIVVGHATVPSGGAVTVAAVSTAASKSSGTGTTAGGIGLQVFTDDLAPPAAGHANVRVIHTILGAPPVTTQLKAVTSGSSTPVVNLDAVGFAQASPYAPVDAGTYQVVVKAPTGAVVADGQDWTVSAGAVVSIVIVEATSGPTLEILSDAAAAGSTPNGAMQTGFGGTAPKPGVENIAMLSAGLALLLLVVLAGYLRLRRSHYSLTAD